jgi:nitrous oxidase accessory protein NosD
VTRPHARQSPRRPAHRRLRLEPLEDRTVPSTFTVTTTADSGPGSLRQAVLDANAAPGADAITFDPVPFATAQTVQLTGGQLTITDPVTIQGPAAGLTLDAGGLSGHFTISLKDPLGAVSISGLTLTGGGGEFAGASIVNRNAALTLSNMVIVQNMNGGISVGLASSWGYAYGYGSVAALMLTDSTVADNSGGGINIVNGEASINHSTISGNASDSGGGINVGFFYSYGFGIDGGYYSSGTGSLTLTDSTVRANAATYSGGGINVTMGQATVVHSTISGNVAGFVTGSGGGINVQSGGALTVAGSTITGNAADYGGGVYCGPTLVMDDSTVSRNKALTAGGGVYLKSADAVIRNSTISGNVVSGGAAGRGGGLALSSSTLTLQNSTVAFNAAGTGSGGGIDNSYTGIDNTTSAINLHNVILSNNVASSAGPDLNGPANANFSLISDTAQALITGAHNLLDIDACLTPLADNGGPTWTHRPGAGSPARNAGGETTGMAADQRGAGYPRVLQGWADIGAIESTDPTPIAVATVPAVTVAGGTVYVIAATYSDDTGIRVSSLGTGDITVSGYGLGGQSFYATPTFVWADVNGDGTPRLATYVFKPPGGAWGPEDDGVYTVSIAYGEVSDADATPHTVPWGAIGKLAVLIPATYVVDEVSDVNDGNYSSGRLSLREAVALANALPGSADTITFSPTAFGTARTIALVGDGYKLTDPVTIVGPPAGLTLDGGGVSRLFQIDMARPGDAVSIAGLTLTHGSADYGGAVVNVDAALTLSKTVVSRNAADAGGGVFVAGGSLTLTDSTVSGNTAGTGTYRYDYSGGGGIFASPDTSVTITRSTISGNRGIGWGGGILVTHGSSFTMTGSTVSGNAATDSISNGGGICLLSVTSAAIRNSTIAYNSAGWFVGGILPSNSNLTIESTIVSNNTAAAAESDLVGTAKVTFSLIGNAAGAALDPASANNLLNLDPRLAPLADNGGPTWTHALLAGSPAVDAGSNPAGLATDQRGPGFPRLTGLAADIGAFEAPFVPAVVSVAVNGGAAQRSLVTDVTVRFNAAVKFAGDPADAFRLTRTGPGSLAGDVALAVDLSASTATQTVARLTFSGPLTAFGSLIDGTYTLTVLGSRVSAGGVSLDGDGDGLPGGDSTTSLFRLYGDVNGDRAVNGLELGAFRAAFGTALGDANYLVFLDVNGDGAINGLDLAQFRSAFGRTI